jgi:hypothetical protein
VPPLRRVSFVPRASDPPCAPQLYDTHVTTRIAIAIVTCFFAAIASCALCFDLRDHHTVRCAAPHSLPLRLSPSDPPLPPHSSRT